MDGTFSVTKLARLVKLQLGPGTDAAQKKYEEIQTFILSEDVIKLEKHPATAARFPDERWGFGDEAYMG